MQDLIKHNGYSIFCYLTPISDESWKANIMIQDIQSKSPPELPIQLPDVFVSKEQAMYRAKEYGRKLVDDIKDTLPDTFMDTDINFERPE